MESLPFELVRIIMPLLGFEDKINLHSTSKQYNFVLEHVYSIPEKYVIDKKILKFVNLTSLNLTCNKVITDEVVMKLSNLTSLDLTNNKLITDVGIQRLYKLTSLNLIWNNSITDFGLRFLNLTSLNLAGNELITDIGVQSMCSSLTSLDLTSNDSITDNGVAGLSNLTNLNLLNNYSITDKGIQGMCVIILHLHRYELISNEGIQNLNLTSLPTGNSLITNKYNQWLGSIKLRLGNTLTTYGGVSSVEFE